MTRTLPEGIVTALTELGEALADWCLAGRDQSLAAHEAAVLERVRRALPGLLRAVVQAATRGLAPPPRAQPVPAPCPRCGEPTPAHELVRTRTLATQCGPLTLQRPWYHCAPCGHGFSVVETVLAVPERARLSAGLHAWLVLLGATTVFRDGVDLLATLTGLPVGRETVRRHSEAAGTALADAEDAALARVEASQAPAGDLDPAPGLLVVETDGVMVRFLDGWHEVKLGLVGGWQEGELHAPSYVAAREPAERFGARLAAEAATRGALEVVRWEGGITGRGLAVLREAAILGDGAVWIWQLADERFADRIEVVDAYHAIEHLHTVARALWGEGDGARTWARTQAGVLLAQGVAPVLAALDALRPATTDAATIRRQERGYFARNTERMDYPTLRLDGLPIGSGGVESAGDHLVQRRMKRSGMRWSDAGGRALLTLRARLRSGRPLTAAAAGPCALPVRRSA
jgi:hypothetical protein